LGNESLIGLLLQALQLMDTKRTYKNRITKNTINKKSSELISERIILEAKRLLVHSEDSLADIAEFLGYEDYAYFSRVFKLKTKSSPSDFRNHYKTKTPFEIKIS